MKRDAAAIKSRHSCLSVAPLLGLTKAREAHKWSCAVCGSQDNLHIYPDGLAWRCYGGCNDGERGDVIDLVRVMHRVEFEAACDILEGTPMTAAVRPQPKPRRKGFPPRAEVATVRLHCGGVQDHAAVAEYVESRGLDPSLFFRDIAGAFCDSIAVPDWASWWGRAGYRLHIPLVDTSGETRSVRARRIIEDDSGRPKSVVPLDYTTRGLIMACYRMRGWLQLRSVTTDAGDLAELNAELQHIIVTEGEIDFLHWATTQDSPVIGIGMGSWTPELGQLIPRGCEVTIATDDDASGDRYYDQVARTLSRGCVVRRWRAE